MGSMLMKARILLMMSSQTGTIKFGTGISISLTVCDAVFDREI